MKQLPKLFIICVFEEFGDGFKVTIFRKVSNASEKVSNAFEKYLPLLREANVTDIYINNIEKVFDHCGIDMPFGQANVMEWLGCSKSKAANFGFSGERGSCLTCGVDEVKHRDATASKRQEVEG